MQESYISLDPAKADSMSYQVRSRVWKQRVQEACGGEAGLMMANQFGITAMVCTYTIMRGRGFRITPFSASKLPSLAGLILVGFVGANFGSTYARVVLGSTE